VTDEDRLEDRYHGLLRPVEVRSATDVTFERLQTLIMSGRLQAGDRLPSEAELARALKVGRSTIREAKKALMTQGLLESRGKLGTFVTVPSADSDLRKLLGFLSDPTLHDLHEARQIVEVAAIRLAAERATASDIAEMRGTIERLKVGFRHKEAEMWTLMVDFHRNIVKASGNQVLVSIFDLIARLVRLHQVPYYQSIADPQSELRSHQDLLDLVEQRSPEAAATAMMRHLEDAERLRNMALEDAEGKDDPA
jgi:GntR family transcriptional regulator, transcriptional repressor for pyruvate dehydrogenase complex